MITVMNAAQGTRSPGGRPGQAARWSPRHWVIDVVVMAVTLGFSSLYAFGGSTISPMPVWAAALVTVGFVAPLAVRRARPVPVFAWCLLVAVASGWWAMQVAWSPALLVALYTVAATRSRRAALTATALLAVAAVPASLHVDPAGWYVIAVALLACVIAALGLGLYAAARHALVAELRERAFRLEVERDQQGQLAAAAERARIAREMHDIVAHHLTAMVALSDGAAAQVSRDPERAEAAMAEVASTGRLALRDTRHLLGVLREDSAPAGRAPLPAGGSVDELVERVRGAGLAVRYSTSGDAGLASPAVQLCVYRVIQEALTNTMKHAGPGAHASVAVQYAPSEACVVVEDDGEGNAPARGARPFPASGHGLNGMRERVSALGGEVTSGPGTPRGWTVCARIPAGPAGPVGGAP